MGRNEWTNEKLFYRLLNNKSQRTYWDNVRSLRKRPVKEVFDRCIELTMSEDAKAREIGIDILAQLGLEPRPFYTESNKCFFELLETEQNPEVMMSLLYAIGHNHDKLSKTQIDRLCTLGDTTNSLIKKALVWSLLFINDSNAIDTLIKLSADKLNHIRDWATFGLGQSERNNKKIRAALWSRINDKHYETRYEAIWGLAVRKVAGIKELIERELLTGEYGTLLLTAIKAYGDKDFLPLLKQHLKQDIADKEISADWLKSLKECIEYLDSATVTLAFPSSLYT